MKYEELMKELDVFVVYCKEGVANFSYHVAESSIEAAISLVKEKRPRVTIISSEKEPLFSIAGIPKIRRMEKL
jgi:hypothetical protein